MRKQPFWRVKERLALRLLEQATHQKLLEAVFSLRATSQGFPGKAVNVELTKDLMAEARKACRKYSHAVAPWIDTLAMQTEEDQRQELLGESAGMIEAWIAHFEPENLQQYREQMAKAVEGMKTDA